MLPERESTKAHTHVDINKVTYNDVNDQSVCTWAEGDGAGHQRVAGVEQNHLVLLQLQRRLEGREWINHLIASVQNVTVLQTLATCTGERRLIALLQSLVSGQ